MLELWDTIFVGARSTGLPITIKAGNTTFHLPQVALLTPLTIGFDLC